MFEPNVNLGRDLRDYVSDKLDGGAQALTDELRERLSAGPRSGIHHSGLPRRSSAPGEDPQEQFSNLKNSVNWQPTNDPLAKQVGIMGHPLMSTEELLRLENGDASGTLQGRHFMARLKESEDAHKRAREAMSL